MWETPAVSASSKERCEGWDSFTVPCFARFRHFNGPFWGSCTNVKSCTLANWGTTGSWRERRLSGLI